MADALPAATTTSVRVVAIRQQIDGPVVGQFARKGMGRGKGFLFCLRDIPVPNFFFVNCVSFEFLSKSSSRGGSNILVDNWVSSPEKGLDNSSEQEWVANSSEKGEIRISWSIFA